MPEQSGLREEPHELLPAQNGGQLRRLPSGRNDEARDPPPQRHVIEEAQGRDGLVAGAVAAPLLAVEMEQIGRDLPLRDPLGRAPVVPGELGHGAEIGGLGALRQTPQDQILGHPFAKRGHGGISAAARARPWAARDCAPGGHFGKDRDVSASAGKTGRAASRLRVRHPAPRVSPLPRQRLRSTPALGQKSRLD
jgi:hypothetical protein